MGFISGFISDFLFVRFGSDFVIEIHLYQKKKKSKFQNFSVLFYTEVLKTQK